MHRTSLWITFLGIFVLSHPSASLPAAEMSEGWETHHIGTMQGVLVRMVVGSWFEEEKTQLIVSSKSPDQGHIVFSPAGNDVSIPWLSATVPAEAGVSGVGMVPLNNGAQNAILIGNLRDGLDVTFTPTNKSRDLLVEKNLRSTSYNVPDPTGLANMAVGDFDDDGSMEVVAGGSGWNPDEVERTEIYLVRPGAAFWLPSNWDSYKIGEKLEIRHVAAHDMNDDGHLDALFFGGSKTKLEITWLENPGLGFDLDNPERNLWKAHVILSPAKELIFMVPCNVEHPAFPSTVGFVSSHNYGQVCFYFKVDDKWEGRLFSNLRFYPANGGDGVRVGDLTGDDQPDLVLSCRQRNVSPKVSMLIHTPMLREDGKDISPENSTVIAKVEGGNIEEYFDLVDVDNDGDLDVVYAYQSEDREFALKWAENPLVP